MIENEQKGWHGAFSSIGKYSAEKYHIITHKDEILNRKTSLDERDTVANFLRRNGYHNIFGETKPKTSESLDDSQLDIIEDNIDIFQLDTKKKVPKDKKKKSKKNGTHRPFTAYHRTNKTAYKYHDKHMAERKKVRKETTPDCTKYVPNRELVWKRTLVGPAWKTMKARQPMGHKDNSKFYLQHNDPLKDIGHSFIDMDKQTMRGDFFKVANPRFNSARAFTPKQRRPISSISRASSFSYQSESNVDNMISRRGTKNIESANKKKSKNESKITEKEEDDYEDEEEEEEKENDEFVLDANEKINKEINDKWKRGASAVSRQTRPGTARPMSVTTTFSSRPTTTNNNRINSGNNLNTSEISNGEIVNNENDLDSSSSELNDSYEQFRHVYEKQLKKRPNTAKPILSTSNLTYGSSGEIKPLKSKKKSTLNKNNNYSRKRRPQTTKKKPNYIKAVDFDKLISREYLDNIADKKQSLIPFSLPNFKQVRERPIMMVVYDRPVHLKNRPKEMKGIEPSMYSDPYKNLDKINNHHTVNVPNFDRISSRPDDKNPLPSYMKKNFTREAVYSLTDQSLKMNNYAEGKFIKNYTSFWPKKTFNKIINLNLLNSDAFINNVVGDKKKLEKENNYIAKSMKFYNKNYEDLMKEGMLNRFDNVTYKTIKKEQRIDQREMEKFLRNYQNNN